MKEVSRIKISGVTTNNGFIRHENCIKLVLHFFRQEGHHPTKSKSAVHLCCLGTRPATIASRFDWFTSFFVLFVIGQSNYFVVKFT